MIFYSFCLLHMEAPLNGEDERESSSLWHMGRSASQENTHLSGVASVRPPFDRRSIASVPSYHQRGCYGAAFGKNPWNCCLYISLLNGSSAASQRYDIKAHTHMFKGGFSVFLLYSKYFLLWWVSFSERSIWPRSHVQIWLNTSLTQP